LRLRQCRPRKLPELEQRTEIIGMTRRDEIVKSVIVTTTFIAVLSTRRRVERIRGLRARNVPGGRSGGLTCWWLKFNHTLVDY